MSELPCPTCSRDTLDFVGENCGDVIHHCSHCGTLVYGHKRSDLSTVVPALVEAVKPFAKVADGIPPNWPGDCVLTFVGLSDEVVGKRGGYLAYLSINDSDGYSPTIAEWRKLAVVAGS